MRSGTFKRPVNLIIRVTLYSLLLLGLSHCGQKGGLTRPEDSTAAFSAASATGVVSQYAPVRRP